MKGIMTVLLILVILFSACVSEVPKVNTSKDNTFFVENGISYVAKVEDRSFYVYKNGAWKKEFLKGVNMGAGKPGTWPGELAITKEEYFRWFGYISDMNADVIRVYTTQKPDFYEALYLFNSIHEKPLYLMHGVWVNEDSIAELNDPFASNERIKKEFVKDTKDLIDIIHGNATLVDRPGFASGVYRSNVSPYVIGWILGIEWDPNFVLETNKNNANKTSYDGTYLYTNGASPFEVFLCEVGDEIIDYEVKKYGIVRPLSYTNWPPTDILKHPNEPLVKEDIVEVNVEHIKTKNTFPAGLFASYHIYPYYPDFINYQREYVTFIDSNGKINPYKAYLRDLFKKHTMPVFIAEFGIPASRGKAHDSIYTGFNQGNHDESEQGHILESLLMDIHDEGYCGALIFSWQDEWFKRTWNTMDLDMPDSRAYWSNPQTNEQEFGLLAFDPGETNSICYVDGNISEWKEDKPIYVGENVSLYVKSDEKYVYLMINPINFDFEKDFIFIPVDTINGQGNSIDKERNLHFSRPADFLIQINGKDNSRILVDAYYDSFYFIYGEQYRMIPLNLDNSLKNNGIFVGMDLCLHRELYLPQDKITVPFSKYETGKLFYGNGNPYESDFNSLTDFSFKDGNLEIRIPWQLFNVMDPSTKNVMGDFYRYSGIKPEKVEGFYFGVDLAKNGISTQNINMEYYGWKEWEIPTYHERIKPSYYILKEAFKKLN
ncbi:MAG: family 2 glycosyl transferase [Candidatus Methanofastidiosum sp.]|nr:family 2 glycosyl transferase [Methanofastidiosum sp.]